MAAEALTIERLERWAGAGAHWCVVHGHPQPPLTVTCHGRTSGTTTQTDTCSRHNPRKPQGRPIEKPELEAYRANRPTRLRSLNKASVPDRSTPKHVFRIARRYGHTLTDAPASVVMPRNEALGFAVR